MKKKDKCLIYNRQLKKVLITMKLTALLIFVFSIQMYASSYAQVTKINLSMKNATIKEVIEQIEKETDFYFMLKYDDYLLEKQVTLNYKQANINDILTQLFEKERYEYKIIDRYIAVRPIAEVPDERQKGDIQGKVTDSSGSPLPGVTVIIKGTTNGTVTNADGEYSISNIPPDAILQFSFVGMKTQEIPVADKRNINVTMAEETIGIGEVVAIGYGSILKKDVTGSIASVKSDEFRNGAAYQSPLQLVSGKIAGLALSRNNGGDPTGDVKIQLRGVASIEGDTDPLVVINGIPGGSLSSVSPEDIESIDVLRDGSAGAIYGTRANAGVIIITTKKGVEGKPKVEFSSYVYTETWANKHRLLTGNEYRHYMEEFANSGDDFLESKAAAMTDFGCSTDWYEAISREKQPLSQVYNLSISGGSKSTTYYGSISYRDQKGKILKSSKEELRARVSLIHKALDDKLTIQIDGTNSLINQSPFDTDIMPMVYKRNPTMPVYNEDATEDEEDLYSETIYYEQSGNNNANPVGVIMQNHVDIEYLRFLGNTKISYEIIKGLKASVMGAMNYYAYMNGRYEDSDSWSSVNESDYQGYARRNASKSKSQTLEATIDYAKTFNNVHTITALAGYSYQDFLSESFNARNRTFLSDLYTYNDLGAGTAIADGNYTNPVSSSKSTSKLIAFFARFIYNYDNKYMLTASLRREGSSKFGKNHKWGNFPAISAGWTISNEPFMDNVNFIDNLKLRLGYGVTGNQGIDSYLSLSTLSTSGYMYYNGEWIQGYTPSSNANPDLKWEKKAEINMGIDISMFKNWDMSLDIYKRSTTDLLYEYDVPTPPYLYDTKWGNLGEITNQGIEFSVSTSPVRTSKFKWTTNFNISYNTSELVSLSNEEYDYSYLMSGELGDVMGMSGEYTYKLEEGEPFGNIFAYEHAGISDEGEWQVYNEAGEIIHPSEGDFSDKKIVGNGMPKSYFGFNNTFKYRNFDLSANFRGALFFDILNTFDLGKANLAYFPNNIPLKAVTDPELKKLRDSRNYLTSYFVERGDYLKLDNLTLGYIIPAKGIKQLRIYASALNLFCLTKYTGEDPELNIKGLTPGMDSWWQYPKTKTFTLGVNIIL